MIAKFIISSDSFQEGRDPREDSWRKIILIFFEGRDVSANLADKEADNPCR